MAYEDLVFKCADCGCDFEFTAAEQEFYQSKGLQNYPKRCKPCRQQKKNSSRGGGSSYGKKMYNVICSECGAEAQVPFKPSNDRPVLCRSCYANS